MTSIFSFQPRYPIWKQIKEFLKPQEENEVRAILGENMLIRNDIAHQEVESLLSIIYELHNTNNEKYSYELNEKHIYEQQKRAKEKSSLLAPEKKIVKDQIKFFISNLNLLKVNNNNNNNKNDEDDIVETIASTPRERAILKSVLPEHITRKRPTSSPSKFRMPTRPPNTPPSSYSKDIGSGGGDSSRNSSKKKRDPSPKIKIDMSNLTKKDNDNNNNTNSLSTTSSTSTLINSSRPSTAAQSSRSVPIGILEKVEGFLNVFDIDQVISDIKILFEDEYKDLLADIDYLNIKLEEEHTNTMKIEATSKMFKQQREDDETEEPTLNELRKMSAKLEDTYLNSSNNNEKNSKMREPSSRHNGSSGRARLASLRLKKSNNKNNHHRNNNNNNNNNNHYNNEYEDDGGGGDINNNNMENDYKPRRKSKSSRLRKRLQAAKEEDQDAKYFI